MSLIGRAVRRVSFYRWAIAVVWRQSSGRWYVFRDAPDWFVDDVAYMMEYVEDWKEYPDVLVLVTDAIKERDLRLRRKPLDAADSVTETRV